MSESEENVKPCPATESSEDYPCVRTGKRILEMLDRHEKLLDEHAKTLNDVVKTVGEMNANVSQVVDHQRTISQHLFNLEKRYSQLDCLRPKRPSEEVPPLTPVPNAGENG